MMMAFRLDGLFGAAVVAPVSVATGIALKGAAVMAVSVVGVNLSAVN
jgi:hypothetical protein